MTKGIIKKNPTKLQEMHKAEDRQQQKRYLSVEEMANELGIAMMNAYALCKRPGFPAVRVSERRIVIPVDALERWMEENAGI